MTLDTTELIGGASLLTLAAGIIQWLLRQWQRCRARVKELTDRLDRERAGARDRGAGEDHEEV